MMNYSDNYHSCRVHVKINPQIEQINCLNCVKAWGVLCLYKNISIIKMHIIAQINDKHMQVFTRFINAKHIHTCGRESSCQVISLSSLSLCERSCLAAQQRLCWAQTTQTPSGICSCSRGSWCLEAFARNINVCDVTERNRQISNSLS